MSGAINGEHSKCISILSEKKVHFNERRTRSEFILDNKNEIEIKNIKIDYCIITKGIRCDFAAVIPDNDITYWIELKGRDVNHAIKQLTTSFENLKKHFGKKNNTFIIVCTYCPWPSTKLQILSRKLKEKYNATLKVRSNSLTISI